ncbi:BT_3928 family protein [Chryseobacterium oryctis]|uniref:DoxX family protein n=1 Tax=Chryseobacterium oryctis TaxID=2952618 RepID=A0ABT3HN66_9FLAO|nr:BT_3928 family protein [Chryseobacterium oryctis]MCW3161220.1 DoxX family protein [Chryseobacterium oryctis]
MLKGLLRFIIAVIFILSGFVKAVDLVGFSFKMEEYFSPTVFNMPFFEKFALLFSIIVVVLELLLGFMLLLKLKLKFSISALIVLCIFFGFLTFYSAYFNVVTDCGCFGDAIKFTPWQSFIKDIVLLFGLIILFLLYKNEFKKKDDYSVDQKESSSKFKYILFGIFSLVMIGIMSYGIAQEPIIDFRDYKIGTDLKAEKEKIAKNPSEYKTFYSLKNQKTGEILKVNQDDYINETKYWEEGSPWKIEEGKNESVMVKEGYQSEIVKFKIEDPSGLELTNEIINAPKAVLVFSYHPKEVSAEMIQKIENKIKTEKAVVYGVSTDPNTFKTIKNAMMDGTAIKTIARSNPFVLTIQNGKIVDKQPAKNYIK